MHEAQGTNLCVDLETCVANLQECREQIKAAHDDKMWTYILQVRMQYSPFHQSLIETY